MVDNLGFTSRLLIGAASAPGGTGRKEHRLLAFNHRKTRTPRSRISPPTHAVATMVAVIIRHYGSTYLFLPPLKGPKMI